MLGGGRSNSWDLPDYIFVNGNASILTWGVGVTAQGETLTLDMGEGWALKGKLGALALSAGVRSSPDEKIPEVGDWWVGAGYGVGVGATMMRWFSVPMLLTGAAMVWDAVAGRT